MLSGAGILVIPLFFLFLCATLRKPLAYSCWQALDSALCPDAGMPTACPAKARPLRAMAQRIMMQQLLLRALHTPTTHALRHIEAYLTAFMITGFQTKECFLVTSDEVVLEWALMADKFDMHELCGHCERAMVMCWDSYHKKPELIDQLSSGALQRIAKGLHFTQNRCPTCGYYSNITAHHPTFHKYPDACHISAWRQQKQPTAQ